MEVVCEHVPIIINIYAIQENVNNLFLIIQIIRVAVLELTDPFHNLLLRVFRSCQLRLHDADIQITAPGFELVKPFLGGRSQHSGLNGIQHIFNAFFAFFQLFPKRRDCRIFFGLQFHNAICNSFNRFIIRQNLIDRDDYCRPFNQLFLNSFQLATVVMLGSCALVIVMFGSSSASPAFPSKHLSAFSAEKLGCQQILFIRLGFCGSMPIALHALLNPVKLVFFDDNRQFIWNANRSIMILAQVLPVFQHSSQAGNSKWFPCCC